VARDPRTSDTDRRVGDLRTWLQRYGAMAPAPALLLVAQLSAELGALHKQGQAHGAVEPGNVLLHTARDGTLVGHLRSPETSVDHDSAYRAPERHADPAATSRGDVYSLGCLLWACLTGAPPYSGSHQALHPAGGEPVPHELDALLEGMLRTNPVDRFSSAAEIGREAAWIAERFDSGQQAAPVAAARQGTATSSWKNIGMVGLVGIALLAIAVGGYAVVNLTDDPADPPAEAVPAATVPSSQAPVVAPPPAVVVKKTSFTCWSGRTVHKKKKCHQPHGTRGMYWIFPLLKGQNCRPRQADSTPGRDSLLECYFYGRQVKLNVSLWRDTRTGESHYADLEHLGQPSTDTNANGKPGIYRWEDVSRWRGYRYVTVRLWRKHSYSVAVYARRHALADAVRNSGYLAPVPDNRYYGSKND
jgi:hypothetical protein